MSSVRLQGIQFRCFPDDHRPPHVHAFYAEVQVIVELLENAVTLSNRDDAALPANASRADVRHVLQVAAKHHRELKALWEMHHGRD